MVPALTLLALLLLTSARGDDANSQPLENFPCLRRDYRAKKEKCRTDFFQSFQIHKGTACGIQFKKLYKCVSDAENACLEEASHSKNYFITKLYEMYKLLSKGLMEPKLMKRLYCHNAGLAVVRPTSKNSNSRCSDKFFEGKEKCMENFLTKFRRDRGDPKLCSERARMDQCVQLQRRIHCSKEAKLKLKQFEKSHPDLASNKRNPFCNPTTDQSQRSHDMQQGKKMAKDNGSPRTSNSLNEPRDPVERLRFRIRQEHLL